MVDILFHNFLWTLLSCFNWYRVCCNFFKEPIKFQIRFPPNDLRGFFLTQVFGVDWHDIDSIEISSKRIPIFNRCTNLSKTCWQIFYFDDDVPQTQIWFMKWKSGLEIFFRDDITLIRTFQKVDIIMIPLIQGLIIYYIKGISPFSSKKTCMDGVFVFSQCL